MPIQQYKPAEYMGIVDTTLHRLIGDSLPNTPDLFQGTPQHGIDFEARTTYAQTYCRIGVQGGERKGFNCGVRVESWFPEFQGYDSLMVLEPVLRKYAFFGSNGAIDTDVMLESDDFSTVTRVVINKRLTATESKALTSKYETLKGKSLEDGITALVQAL